MSKAGSIVS